MASAGNKKDIWLPGAYAANAARGKAQRGIAQLRKELNRLGFEPFIRHDAVARTIEVEFRPLTERVAQAVKVASQSSQANALRVAVSYEHGESPGEKTLACIKKGIETIREEL